MKINNKYFIYLALLLLTIACNQPEDVKSENERSQEKIEERDSILTIYTVKEWRKKNWYTFNDYSTIFKISDSHIKYFIGSVFTILVKRECYYGWEKGCQMLKALTEITQSPNVIEYALLVPTL